MSSVRQKMQAIHKAMLKKEEEILNGNQQGRVVVIHGE